MMIMVMMIPLKKKIMMMTTMMMMAFQLPSLLVSVIHCFPVFPTLSFAPKLLTSHFTFCLRFCIYIVFSACHHMFLINVSFSLKPPWQLYWHLFLNLENFRWLSNFRQFLTQGDQPHDQSKFNTKTDQNCDVMAVSH